MVTVDVNFYPESRRGENRKNTDMVNFEGKSAEWLAISFFCRNFGNYVIE